MSDNRSQSVAPASIVSPANPQQPTTVTFVVPPVPLGTYTVRLRVDGVDNLPVTLNGTQFDLDPNQQVTV